MQSLADHLGVTKGAVSQWKLDGRRIPAEHCPVIERLTEGEVRCEALRPDVDWEYLRLNSCCEKTAPQCAGDPDPMPDHPPRNLPSAKGIMGFIADQPLLTSRKLRAGPP